MLLDVAGLVLGGSRWHLVFIVFRATPNNTCSSHLEGASLKWSLLHQNKQELINDAEESLVLVSIVKWTLFGSIKIPEWSSKNKSHNFSHAFKLSKLHNKIVFLALKENEKERWPSAKTETEVGWTLLKSFFFCYSKCLVGGSSYSTCEVKTKARRGEESNLLK